jgi:hypothetical protein
MSKLKLKLNGRFVWRNPEKTEVKFISHSEKTSSETIKGFSLTIGDKTSQKNGEATDY